MKLRPAQEEILRYRGGLMAVSAVPGSGKTFTLSLLAARLIADGYDGGLRSFRPQDDQQVLIVTYLNASVDTFRARIRKQLSDGQLPPDRGYDVRTLHSLGLEIVRAAEEGLGAENNETLVLDEVGGNDLMARAAGDWITGHLGPWLAHLPEDNPQLRARWRNDTESTARSFVRSAKNLRLSAGDIWQSIADQEGARGGEELALLEMFNGIYERYQTLLNYQGVLDFDDLIWRAAELLQQRADLAQALRTRWPFILEDEAQDSVPLQEALLGVLSGESGNWVRVGDPNQAITSSFTAANPRYFDSFLDRDDVVDLPLPNSGRSAPLIFGAANALLDWVVAEHPLDEVRQHTFRRQYILPTPEGDSQPNPPDNEAGLVIKVFHHREDEELPGIAQMATNYAEQFPDRTLAILTPTNQMGHRIADSLDRVHAAYDNLLRGGGREREIAAAMHAVLSLLANPLNPKALVLTHEALLELGHPAVSDQFDDLDHFYAVLRSTHKPEGLIFPWEPQQAIEALPLGAATEEEIDEALKLAGFVNRLFALRPLPIDDLALALGDEMFAHEGVPEADLATAYQIATALRNWREAQPTWRLPELVAELGDVVRGRRKLVLARPSEYGYEPQPGRISLATQHGAKGLEWDAVFLVGMDGRWLPNTLDSAFQGVINYLGYDPAAEVAAQLRYINGGDPDLHKGLTATDSAHVEVISERLRLLYVGITRARRYLHISRSRATRSYNKELESAPATAIGELYRYLRRRKKEAG